MLIEMLKNRNHRPCPCGSGRKYGKCCGDPAYLAAKRIAAMRECGDCQACCELVGVQELGKPYASRCAHQCSTGCAIYALVPSRAGNGNAIGKSFMTSCQNGDRTSPA